MAYKVTYKGLEVVCETADELDALAERGKERRRDDVLTYEMASPLSALASVVKTFRSSQKKLLRLLVEGGRTDKELRDALGLESNKGLAGIFAGISKRLVKAKFDAEMVWQKETRRDGNEQRLYYYTLIADAAPHVRKGLGMN